MAVSPGDEPRCGVCAEELEDYEVEDGYCCECQHSHTASLQEFPKVLGTH